MIEKTKSPPSNLPHATPQARTQMTVDNLAIVFCPNLLRCTSDDPTVVMRNANREFKYVKELILAADFLR